MAETTVWLTIPEAADHACCGRRTLVRAARGGRLQSARIHGELRFLERWIDEWLADQVMPEDREIAVGIDAASSCRSW